MGPAGAGLLAQLDNNIAPTGQAGSQAEISQGANVDPATGVVNYSVPLMSIADGEVAIALQANYSSQGNKLHDVGGVIGYGWHLNVGGVITREVRGIPDDDVNGWFVAGTFSQTNMSAVAKAYNGELDAAPDLFRFQAGGYSGTFVVEFPSKQILQVPQTDCEIYATWDGNRSGSLEQVDGFVVVTPDGVRYTFGGAQTAASGLLQRSALSEIKSATRWSNRARYGGGWGNQYYPTSFLLSEVSHPNHGKLEYIYQNSYSSARQYRKDNFAYPAPCDEVCTDPSNPACLPESLGDPQTYGLDLRLLSIRGEFEQVDFTYGDFGNYLNTTVLSRLSKTGGPNRQNVTLQYDRFQSVDRPGELLPGRLPARTEKPALARIVPHGAPLPSQVRSYPPHYAFEYNALTGLQYAGTTQSAANSAVYYDYTDYLGYAKAEANEWFGIPRGLSACGGWYGQGDRDPDHAESGKTLLKKVTNPYGGTSVLTYGPHDYTTYDYSDISDEYTCSNCSPYHNPGASKVFILEDEGSLTGATLILGGYGQQNTTSTGTVDAFIRVKHSGTGETHDFPYTLSDSNSPSEANRPLGDVLKPAFGDPLPYGRYEVQLGTRTSSTANFCGSGCTYTEVRAYYKIRTAGRRLTLKAPGSRVATTTASDGRTAATTTHAYLLPGSSNSSGLVAGRPGFWDVSLGPGPNRVPGHVTIQQPSEAALSFYTGNHVRYLAIASQTPGLGKVVREFARSDDPSSPPIVTAGDPVRRFDRHHGVPTHEAVYADGAAQPYATTEYKYQDQYQSGTYALPACVVRLRYTGTNSAGESKFEPFPLPYPTPRTIAARVTEVVSSVDGQPTRTTIAPETGLNGPLPASTTVYLPDGTAKRTRFIYSLDYSSSNSSIVSRLRSENRIALPYIQYEYKDGQLLSAQRSEFSYFPRAGGFSSTSDGSSTFLMASRQLYWSYLTQDGNWGKVSSRSLTREVSRLIQVDSRGRPLQTSALGEDLPTVYTYTSDGLLKTETYGAAVTTRAYTDRLLTSTVDASGTTTTRGYDAHNRLAFVEGCDGSRTQYTHQNYPATAANGGYFRTIQRSRASSTAPWQITYAIKDGMGRELQTIQLGEGNISPTAGSNGSGAIYTLTRYDAFGRVERRYAPITKEGYVYGEGLYLSEAMPADARYTDYAYEASPRGRLTTATLNNGFATSYTYGYNTAYEASAGGYPAGFGSGALSRVRVTDPGGHVSESMSDPWGNQIVTYEYAQGSSTQKKAVRYGYDFQNDLRRVSPFAGASESAGETYRYDYNHLSQLTRKVVPGKAEELFYNDYHGRVHERSDFYSRDAHGGEQHWTYRYDDYGAPVQGGLNPGPIANNSTIATPLTEVEYDRTPGSVSFGQVTTRRARMLDGNQWLEDVTEYSRSLDPCGRVVRAASDASTDYGAGGAAVEHSLSYDWNGNLEQDLVTWRLPHTTLSEAKRPRYGADLALGSMDYALSVGGVNRYDNDLYAVTYDKHGALLAQRIDRYGSTTSWLQHVDYAYDGIGRLTTINQGPSGSTSPLVTGTGTTRQVSAPVPYDYVNYDFDQQGRDIFFEAISYTDRQAGAPSGFTPGSALHVGLVRQTVKQTKGRRPVVESYDYDDYLRLSAFEAHETYAVDGTLYPGTNEVHAEATYRYDDYGRPGAITRAGIVATAGGGGADFTRAAFDDLTFDYAAAAGDGPGPQARRILENQSLPYRKTGHATAVDGPGDRYIYNANGDVTLDPYRGLAFAYNLVGRLARVSASGTDQRVARYDYSADGTLRGHERRGADGALVERVHYVEVTRVDVVRDEVYLPNAVGAMLVAAGGTVRDVYYQADHVGNVVMAYHDADRDGVIDTDRELVEESRYFPYGMKLEAYRASQTEDIPFAFNGAEELTGFDGLHLTTYRTMAPETALWGQGDPKAEWDYETSPYSSMGGNPIMRSDPKGDFWHIVAGAVIGAGINVFTHWDNITAGGKVNWGEFGKAAGIGAAAGVVGAATGGAALGAAGLSATSFAGGALAGAVGAAYSSPILGVGNNIAFNDPYSVKQWGLDIVTGAGIGGVAGGASNLLKNARPGAVQTNFWTDNVIGTGRSRWSFVNSPIEGANSARGLVSVGQNGRVIDARSVGDFADANGLAAGRTGTLDQSTLESLLSDMDAGVFDATKYAVGGYRQGGTYILGEGHHRVTAAIIHGMRTENYSILETLISAGKWGPAPPGTPRFNWITKWK